MKINLILGCLLLVALTLLQYYRINAKQVTEKAINYQRNNELLLKQIRRVYEDKIKLQQQNAELEKAAKADERQFDWFYNIEHTAVIKQLRGH